MKNLPAPSKTSPNLKPQKDLSDTKSSSRCLKSPHTLKIHHTREWVSPLITRITIEARSSKIRRGWRVSTPRKKMRWEIGTGLTLPMTRAPQKAQEVHWLTSWILLNKLRHLKAYKRRLSIKGPKDRSRKSKFLSQSKKRFRFWSNLFNHLPNRSHQRMWLLNKNKSKLRNHLYQCLLWFPLSLNLLPSPNCHLSRNQRYRFNKQMWIPKKWKRKTKL